MRKTLTTAAIIVSLGVAGPTPTAWAIPGPGDGPILAADCHPITGCVVPEPDPDPTVKPWIPAGIDGLTVEPDDPCIVHGICPPDPDPDPDPDPTPPVPPFDDLVLEEACEELFEPCPDDGEDPDEEPEEPQEPEEPGDTPEPEEPGVTPEPEEPGDTPEPEEPGDPEETPDPEEPGDSSTGIDTPRPGTPNFTG